MTCFGWAASVMGVEPAPVSIRISRQRTAASTPEPRAIRHNSGPPSDSAGATRNSIPSPPRNVRASAPTAYAPNAPGRPVDAWNPARRERAVLERRPTSLMKIAIFVHAFPVPSETFILRQAAQLMRKFSNMTGMEFGPNMQEALRRMEAGEDPEAVEADLGEALEKEDPFAAEAAAGGRKGVRRPPPRRDEKLYELE